MPPLPIITDVYRCALNFDNGGTSKSTNVIHLLKSGTSASAIATLLDTNATALMWTYLTANYVCHTVVVTPLDGSGATFTLATSGAKWTGQNTGDMIPAGANVISFRTAFRGRSNRGRLFIGPVAEGSAQNGVLTTGATLTNCQSAWNTWLANLIAAGAQPVVASYLHASQHPISSIIVESTQGTQRRRQSRLR